MSIETPLVHILMRNHNAYSLTRESLQSLLGLTYLNFRITVIDDGSEDDSSSKILEEFPGVELIKTDRYIEYCKSFNIGIRHAMERRAEFVFLVNNDTKDFSPNYLEEIVATFESDSKIGLVGSWCYDYDGQPNWQGIPKMKLGVPMETPTEGFVVRRELFETIGLLNEKLVRYFEDLDFIIRLRRAGFETRAVSTVSFAHLGGGTSSKQIFIPNYYRVRNVILFMKHYCSDRSMRWKVKTFVHYLDVHVERLKFSLKTRQFRKSIKLVASILAGVLTGLVFRWEEVNVD